MRVTVLDMQPIDPPTGGGRLRLLGLYHALGPDISTTYVGTYDWPGPPARDQMLSDTLRERLIPLTPSHFAEADAASARAGGRTVIDSAFHMQVHLSPEFLQAARDHAAEADVVIYSHPWLHPVTADVLDRRRQTVIYDSHNVEGKLRMALLDDGGAGTEIVREVVRIERDLCRSADLVLACSAEDAQAFTRLYGTDPARLRLLPNGSFTERGPARSAAAVAEAKAALDMTGRVLATFLGSAYGPNVEAARFMIDTLAPTHPGICFVIAGGVGEAVAQPERDNVVVTGPLDEDEKARWLMASDIAVNPMFGGSGTNIKMLDFMAAGLPIVTTQTGGRGLLGARSAFRVADRTGFGAALAELAADTAARAAQAEAGLHHVRRHYSWERLSPRLGRIAARRHARHGLPPQFSVIVPTYERHAQLDAAIACLEAQTLHDFELIIIDQSAERWPGAETTRAIDLTYVHTDVRGAVSARNLGADIATGAILAFTDDDCRPPDHWLAAAAARFATEAIAGLEGLIRSSHHDDADWRPVTNEGFEGMGFMTANLFLRADVFQAVGGFDPIFEEPHFREDTDLGWRAQTRGPVPFSQEAWTYHPPHPRTVERESLAERSRFFVNDAKLMQKHPERYTDLFLVERQWVHNPFFLTYFQQGLVETGAAIPDRLAAAIVELGLALPEPAPGAAVSAHGN